MGELIQRLHDWAVDIRDVPDAAEFVANRGTGEVHYIQEADATLTGCDEAFARWGSEYERWTFASGEKPDFAKVCGECFNGEET